MIVQLVARLRCKARINLGEVVSGHLLDIPFSQLYPRISALRRAGVIETRFAPDDDKPILISSDSLDVTWRAVRRDDSS